MGKYVVGVDVGGTTVKLGFLIRKGYSLINGRFPQGWKKKEAISYRT